MLPHNSAMYMYIYIYIYIYTQYIHRIIQHTTTTNNNNDNNNGGSGQRHNSPELAKVKCNWKMSLAIKIHREFPVIIHWKSDSPLEHTTEQ